MPWQILNILPTSDERAIKRAYAARLKQTRPEDDPDGFAVLREAFEFALHLARQLRAQEAQVLPEPAAAAPLPPTAAPGISIATGLKSDDTPLQQTADDTPAVSTLLRPDPPVRTVYWRDKQAALDVQVEDLQRAAFDTSLDDTQLRRLAAQYGWLNLVEPPKAIPHEWLRRVRQRLHERMVSDLVTQLAGQILDDPHLVARQFFDAVEAPDWEALDLRAQLESTLAQWLATQEPAPLTLMQALADWANWRDASGYARLGISPAAIRVCQRIDLETTWQAWQKYARPPLKGEEPFRYRVFNALLQPGKPWRRRWRSLNQSTQLAVRALSHEIRHAYPELYRRLDADNIAWWSRWHIGFGKANLLELLLATATQVNAIALLGPPLESRMPSWGLLAALLLGALGSVLCWLLTSQLKFGWGTWLSHLGSKQPALQAALNNGYAPFWALLGSLVLGFFPAELYAALLRATLGVQPNLLAAWLGISAGLFCAISAMYRFRWLPGVQLVSYLRRNWWLSLPLLLFLQGVIKAVSGKLG